MADLACANREAANECAQKAEQVLRLGGKGSLEEAITLLEKACRMDPTTVRYKDDLATIQENLQFSTIAFDNDGRDDSSAASSSLRDQEQDQRFITLLRRGLDEIKSLSTSKEVILVIGATGAGKSSLICSLMGYELEHVSNDDDDFGAPLVEISEASRTERAQALGEAPKICHNHVASGTILPELFPLASDRRFVLCDTAGFFDSRGPEYEAIASIFTQYVLKKCRVRGLVLVLSYAGLQATRAEELRKVLAILRKFCPIHELKKINLGVVVSKVNTTPERIRRYFEKLYKMTQAEDLKEVMEVLLSKPLSGFGTTCDIPWASEWKSLDQDLISFGNLASEEATSYMQGFCSHYKNDPILQPVLSELDMILTSVVSVGSEVQIKELGDVVFIGLGWDVSENENETFDLDLAVRLRNKGNRVVQTIDFGNMTTSGVKHTGDNTNGEGEGDDEGILIDFRKIDSSIVSIDIVVHIFAACVRRQTFGMMKNSFVRITQGNFEKEIPEGSMEYLATSLVESQSEAESMLFAKFHRQHGNEWTFENVSQELKEV